MRWAGKDRTGAIVHQNEVCHPDWQFPIAIKRMTDPQAGVKAKFFGGFNRLFSGAALAGLDIKSSQRGVVRL